MLSSTPSGHVGWYRSDAGSDAMPWPRRWCSMPGKQIASSSSSANNKHDNWRGSKEERLKLSFCAMRQERNMVKPAHAIMTPLSWHNAGGGTTNDAPTSCTTSESVCRSIMLLPTPPESTRDVMGVRRMSRQYRKALKQCTMTTKAKVEQRLCC